MMEYKVEDGDLILPILKLPEPCPVRIKIDDKHVFLFVGQRDWQWDRQSGERIGAGTSCCGPVPAESVKEGKTGA